METWKAIPGFTSYEVSNLGRVRRRENAKTRKAGTPLKGCGGNYLRTTLRRGNKPYGVFIHRLVMLAFKGCCPEGKQVAHLDGNSLNNCLSNLAYATPAQNSKQKIEHGTSLPGRLNPRAILSEDQVRKIRKEYVRNSRTSGGAALARKYGVHPNTVLLVVHGRNWSSLR